MFRATALTIAATAYLGAQTFDFEQGIPPG
jgi:hypothetical protein